MYIDSSTFWVIVIGLGIAIGFIYYILKEGIEAHEKRLYILEEVLKKTLEILDDELAKLRDENNQGNIQVYKDIEKLLKSSPTDQKARHN